MLSLHMPKNNPLSPFSELIAGLKVKLLAVCCLLETMAKEVVCYWLLKLGSTTFILHS